MTIHPLKINKWDSGSVPLTTKDMLLFKGPSGIELKIVKAVEGGMQECLEQVSPTFQLTSALTSVANGQG